MERPKAVAAWRVPAPYFVCAACPAPSPNLAWYRSESWDRRLRAAGWRLVAVKDESAWVCPVCAATPQESAALIALRGGPHEAGQTW